MNSKSIRNKIIDLVKINLNICNISKKITLSVAIFSIVIYLITSSLVKVSNSYNLNLNIWDGVFRTITYSSLILGFYFPYIVIITTFFNTKSDYIKFIIVRTKEKSIWIISKILTNVVFGFLFTISFFIIVFSINFLMFKFENQWSEVILNKDSIKLVSILYPNFFVYSLKPLEGFLISFLQIFISSLIVLNLRDLLINYIEPKSVSYSIMSIYLIMNIIIDSYGLNEGIFKINEYIGLGTMSIIFKHNFKSYNGFTTSLGTSIIISLILLFVILFLNVFFSRKALTEND
jgi:hypothetical protein